MTIEIFTEIPGGIIKNYFEGLNTEESIRRAYRTWAKELHPDVGGTDEQMKELGKQYLFALKAIDGKQSTGSDGKQHTYRYSEANESAILEMVQDLQNLRMPNSVTIALIGTWIWVTGDTRPFSEKLGKKGLGLSFSGEKLAWYFHLGGYKRRSGKSGNFQSMAMKYGYKEFANSDNRPAMRA
jgi:curved DNA-binding protein CbpA